MAKTKRPTRKEIEKLAAALPKKDRADFLAQDIGKPWLEEQIQYRKDLMKRDVWIGIPWFLAYTASLFMVGMNYLTATIFVIGLVYFVYTIFTTGTYGGNRRRIKIYEELLGKF